MPAYHVCLILNGNKYDGVYDFIKYLSHYDVVIAGFELNPKPHFHFLIKSRSRLSYHDFRVDGCAVKLIRVKSRRHYFNLLKYIRDHEKVCGGGSVKKEEFVRFVKESFETLRKEVAEIKRELANLKTTATDTATTLKTDVVEVNLSRMNVRLQPARKGVAMRIRFARYIKPNNKGEYYVILTEKDVAQLIQALNTVKIPNTQDDENTVSDSKSVNVVKGFDKAVKE